MRFLDQRVNKGEFAVACFKCQRVIVYTRQDREKERYYFNGEYHTSYKVRCECGFDCNADE